MKGLGDRIKSLRKRQGLTIVDIMGKTGIDKATLSRIENGKMRGTVSTHMMIADALGIRLPELYEDVLSKLEEPKVRRAKEKIARFSHSSGAVAELLTAGTLQKKMMPVLLKIRPKGHTEAEEYSSLSERFLYILKGSLTLIIGDEETVLKKGECTYFNASRPHHFVNHSKIESWGLSIITPVSL